MAENQMEITCLFGAGESTNALSIVIGIPYCLTSFHHEEEESGLYPSSNERFSDHRFQNRSKLEYFQDMLEKINRLADETRNHASKDNLAKNFYLFAGCRFLLREKKKMNNYR